MKDIVLFDLDSTLLQMDQDLFLKKYFALIYIKAKEFGFDPDEFMKVFSKVAYSIVENDGSQTNEELFWNGMKQYYPNIENSIELFENLYKNEFKGIAEIVNKTDIPNQIVKCLKAKGYKLILATNPLFPTVCTFERMSWAGLSPDDFDYVTTYDKCTYCKPKKEYYEEIFNTLGLRMENAIMVGNDLIDDFYYLPKEIDRVLITDHLINTKNLPITMPSFTLAEFLEHIRVNY
ncbi:MAG: HAD family hydrolase [Erysipelotrichaceae bacterium]|nr:HAD family hydrolase [Erysipelotrichaceae bacterium]